MDGTVLRDENVAKYFATINPIASKIQADIETIKTSYGERWKNLSLNEQINAINDAILNSDISLRYFDYLSSSLSETSSASPTPSGIAKSAANDDDCCGADASKHLNNLKLSYIYNGKDLATYCKMKTGRKFLHDDTFGGYRDEHSAPFSFKSKSQVNLNVFPPAVCAASDSKQLLLNTCDNSLNNNDSGAATTTIQQCKPLHNSYVVASNKVDVVNVNQQSTVLSSSNLLKHNNLSANDGALNSNSEASRGDVMINNSNFFSKFVLKRNNIIFDNLVGQNDDEENLVNFEQISTSSMPSEEEIDEKNIEITSLLKNNPLRKDYDFLANW